jgi:hypothetical protein
MNKNTQKLFCNIASFENKITKMDNMLERIDEILKHFVIIEKNDYMHYPVFRLPNINIIGIKDFNTQFTLFLKEGLPFDELIICLPAYELEEYLDDYFIKLTNIEQQFFIDAFRSSVYYNNTKYSTDTDVKKLFKKINNVYSPFYGYDKLLSKKIAALCCQGALAYIICKCQGILFNFNLDYLISELDSKDQEKILVNIVNTNNRYTSILITKSMRISKINHKIHDIDTINVLKFNIEYKIKHDISKGDKYKKGIVESVINIEMVK